MSFDRTGRARMLGIGTCVLRVFPDDIALEPERITLPRKGDAPVEVRWGRR